MLKLINGTKNTVLAERLFVAGRFWSRMVGLLGKNQLPAGEGLLIKPCNAVHMMFMRFPIDLLFLSPDYTVLKTVEKLKPWRFAACRPARMAVELAAGTVARTGTEAGDKLELTENRM
jgi:hypothetical protein